MAGILSFEKTEVAALVTETEQAKSHAVPYTGGDWGEPLDTTPGLMLIGDNGCYLMSNRTDRGAEEEKAKIAYAREANADAMEWDDCYDAKSEIFGGDDGAIPLDLVAVKAWLASAPAKDRVRIELTDETINLLAD